MSLLSRIKVNSIAIVIAVLFALLAIMFAGIALYQHLGLYFLPDIAALFTAAAFLVLALIALLAAKLNSRQKKNKPLASSDSLQEKLTMLELSLQQSVDPAIRNWIIKHPGRSLTLTVLAGTLIGSNADARKLVKQFLDRHLGGD
ncbi:MAG: phage holin family protein [Methylophaga sp.]|nr:phage holin family protein [Methylophaga sp.]